MLSWFFVALLNSLIPLTMIALGDRFWKKPLQKVNWLYGYRTTMSMKNEDTWEFAHRYAGKIWVVSGWATLLITLLVMLAISGQSPGTITRLVGYISLLQCIPLVAVILPTELALNKTFDKNGNRRS